eukprot:jgi/Mesvir1/23963/Mv10729-RA.2
MSLLALSGIRRRVLLLLVSLRDFVFQAHSPSCCLTGSAFPDLVPQVAAGVLEAMLKASEAQDSCFEVPVVITMPPARKGRGRALLPSPVGQTAADKGIPEDRIWCPLTAKEPDFLAQLRALEPDLCVTAAYGNVLPNDFLAIPRRGTVNIHPSLLPLYRGASPVPRAIEHGVLETGVTLAFTVQRMDAGPVIATEVVRLDDDVQAPELLQDLFVRGTHLLLREMPCILSGDAATRAQPQDEGKATKAAKLSKEEGSLAFLPATANAWAIHNRVRAFAGWPGTQARFGLLPSGGGEPTELVLKIVRTRCPRVGVPTAAPCREVALVDDALRVVCGDGSVLQVTEVQPPNKRAMAARDFWNGLRGQQMVCMD